LFLFLDKGKKKEPSQEFKTLFFRGNIISFLFYVR